MFIAHFLWACMTAGVNLRIYIWNTHLVHTIICLITHSFLHGLQPNLLLLRMLYQIDNFEHKSMYLRDTFTLHVDSFHNSDRTSLKSFEWNFRYTSYIDIWIFSISLKKLWHFSLSKLGFNHLCAMIFIPNNNSCHHWRWKLLEIRGVGPILEISQIGDHCHCSYTGNIYKILLKTLVIILSSPVDWSTVEEGNDDASATHNWAFIGVISCSPAT